MDERVSYVWDSWCCGVVLYAMSMGVFPFSIAQLKGSQKLKLYVPTDKSDGTCVCVCV